jgi:hypothetical protein
MNREEIYNNAIAKIELMHQKASALEQELNALKVSIKTAIQNTENEFIEIVTQNKLWDYEFSTVDHKSCILVTYKIFQTLVDRFEKDRLSVYQDISNYYSCQLSGGIRAVSGRLKIICETEDASSVRGRDLDIKKTKWLCKIIYEGIINFCKMVKFTGYDDKVWLDHKDEDHGCEHPFDGSVFMPKLVDFLADYYSDDEDQFLSIGDYDSPQFHFSRHSEDGFVLLYLDDAKDASVSEDTDKDARKDAAENAGKDDGKDSLVL